MEIILDLPFIRGVLADERETARGEIEALGVMAAFARSQERHDSRIAAAPDVGTLACGAGCSWCCHFTVDVRPVEVFAILDFVEHTLPSSERTRIYAEARANSASLRDLDEDARMTRNVKCPFLNSGRCTIYAVRPQSCRNYHATNMTGCQLSYEDPGNLDIDPDFAPGVYQAGGAHVEAFSNAMADAGYDVAAYELNCAVEAALSDPDARRRFEQRLQPFTDLTGEDVPVEFGD